MTKKKNCIICGNEFEYKREVQKGCSRKCSTKVYRLANPEKVKLKRIKYRKKYPEKKRKSEDIRLGKIKSELNRIKLQAGCKDCGYNKNPVALDFDHIKGEKEYNVANCTSLEVALEEIKKCEVVCSNCHRIRTYNRKQNKKNGREIVVTTTGRTDLVKMNVSCTMKEKVNIVVNGEIQN